AEDGIRDRTVTGVQTCALPICINLRIMLKILRATIEVPHEVLVVCDTPEDNSIPVAREMQADYPSLHVIQNNLGRGVVNAIRARSEERRVGKESRCRSGPSHPQ